jgi:myo-inositol 2-dehydrogenase / D-chiro-inositol 1-dehydrogenase
MTVRVGVIGVGVMGAEHARLLTREVAGSEVSAVFDIDADRAAEVAASCDARVLDDPMVLIKDGDVDCVIIASSDATHEHFVLAAVAAGKPVLCEKPLAPETEACGRIMAAEAAAGRQLVGVGFMRRFDPGYLDLRAQARSEDLGALLMLHCVHRNESAVGVPSSVLITGSAVHELDIARWLLADEPESVTVHTPRATSRGGGTQDPMLLVLRTVAGALVDIEVFVNAGYGYEVRCELVAEGGTVLLDTPAETVRRAGNTVGRAVGHDWRGRFGDAYRRELQQWVDALRTGGPSPLASAWDGYVATATAQAAVRSLETGSTQPVVLVDKPGFYR